MWKPSLDVSRVMFDHFCNYRDKLQVSMCSLANPAASITWEHLWDNSAINQLVNSRSCLRKPPGLAEILSWRASAVVCHFVLKATRSLVGPLMSCQSILSNELSQAAGSACRVPQPPREFVIVPSMHIGTARVHSYNWSQKSISGCYISVRELLAWQCFESWEIRVRSSSFKWENKIFF